MVKVPNHIAIIMDGNGRWAKERSLPRAEGHRRGAETIEKIVRACDKRGVRYLTLYAFSEENWLRPTDEIHALMQLLKLFLVNKRDKMIAEGIRFKTIGDIEKLAPDVQNELNSTVQMTSSGKGMTLVIALSYGSRQEILRAVNSLIKRGSQSVSDSDLEREFYTVGIPDPDLLIRTSGECRISNFLLWQLAYTELYFTETLWPDFDENELLKAIESYRARERRFGMTSEQLK